MLVLDVDDVDVDGANSVDPIPARRGRLKLLGVHYMSTVLISYEYLYCS